MDKYLFKISTQSSHMMNFETPKPFYVVATSKRAAREWAQQKLPRGFVAKNISLLGTQVDDGVWTK